MTNKNIVKSTEKIIRSEREIALDILGEVFDKNMFSHISLRNNLSKYGSITKQQKALITRISEGTIEKAISIDYIINQFSKIKVKKMKPLIRNILRISVYQIIYMDNIPVSAVCNEAVKIVKKRGFVNLSGFVNGILRNIIRDMDEIKKSIEDTKDLSIKYSMPQWIVNHFIKSYGEKIAYNILEQTNLVSTKNKISVRVNISKNTVEKVINSLKENGIKVEKSNYADNALILEDYDNIGELDAFKKGEIMVQDISSMLAVQVAHIKENYKCIDMCASPGGKSIYIADLLNSTGMIKGRDLSDKKISVIKENINRCGFSNIITEVKDATILYEEDLAYADVVIADVPCSGFGVMGKKTDIKYKIKEEQLKELAILSQNILKNGVKYLKSGGTFIFSTCTMNPLENEINRRYIIEELHLKPVTIEDRLSEELLNIGSNSETAKEGYLQIFTNQYMDGFFISKFRKD